MNQLVLFQVAGPNSWVVTLVAVVFLFQISTIFVDVEIFCHFSRSLFHVLVVCVLTVSQQGFITTDKIYMVMRESIQKSESEGSKPGLYRPSTNCYEEVSGLQHQLCYLATQFRTGSSSKKHYYRKRSIMKPSPLHIPCRSNWIFSLRLQHLISIFIPSLLSPSSPGVLMMMMMVITTMMMSK